MFQHAPPKPLLQLGLLCYYDVVDIVFFPLGSEAAWGGVRGGGYVAHAHGAKKKNWKCACYLMQEAASNFLEAARPISRRITEKYCRGMYVCMYVCMYVYLLNCT